MIQQGSARLTAAAAALAPFALAGCRRARVSSLPKVKVGILHSQTGMMSQNESTLRDAELLAIEEINASGGVLGHQIEPVVKDPRSGFTDIFPKMAKELLADDQVAVVFGCWTSASRKAVVPIFERFNGLLFYPLQYEGNESSYDVVYSGSLPNQQILPAIDWLISEAGGARKRFYLVGSDYVFPWTAHHVIEKYIASLNGENIEIVGFDYLPLNHRDFARTVQEIKALQPEVIFSTINGPSNQYFFRELATQGISAEMSPVISTSVGEDELRGIDARHVGDHLAVWSYFQSLDTPRNRRFVRRFQNEHGEDRVVSDPMEAAYAQVYLWKLAAEKAKSFEVDALRDALGSNIEFNAPGGKIRLDPKTFHAYKRCRIGRIRDDRQFDIVYESPDLIPPDPYPSFAFPGWNCNWSRGGMTQGPQARISRPQRVATRA